MTSVLYFLGFEDKEKVKRIKKNLDFFLIYLVRIMGGKRERERKKVEGRRN